MRAAAGCEALALALAVALVGCAAGERRPERVFNVPPPAPRPTAPVEARVPKPSPAALAAVVAAPGGPGHDPGGLAQAGASGTAPRVANAPATPAGAEPARNAPPPTTVAATRPGASPPPALPAAIYFDVDHYRVRPRDRELLQQHAAALKANPDLVLVLRGHADGLGPADYNRALAEKRAEMVGRVLATMGVDLQQLRHEAVAGPAAGGAAPARPQPEDRRVELVYLTTGAVAGR